MQGFHAMSILMPPRVVPPDRGTVPELEFGDHLDQPTFHERYERMPADFHAELIGGVVYVASPAKVRHGRPNGLMVSWMGCYRANTPGTEFLPNTTTILGEDSEPEPDGALLIVGGQTRENEDDYLVGPPELTAEVASSSASYDLHSKRRDYEKYGIQEYVVVVVRQGRIVWFVRENDRYVELAPDSDGFFKSRVFPGLWLDPQAFLANDYARVFAVLQQGIASPEHAAFVDALRKRSLMK